MRLYPWPVCCCSFFRSEIGLHRPIVHRHIIINTTEDEVVAVPSQAAVPTPRDQATITGVTAFSGDGATHAASPRQAGSGSESTLIAARSRTTDADVAEGRCSHAL